MCSGSFPCHDPFGSSCRLEHCWNNSACKTYEFKATGMNMLFPIYLIVGLVFPHIIESAFYIFDFTLCILLRM
jgi:hypothetical protein